MRLPEMTFAAARICAPWQIAAIGFCLLREVPDDLEHPRVQAQIFRRPPAGNHQRVVIRARGPHRTWRSARSCGPASRGTSGRPRSRESRCAPTARPICPGTPRRRCGRPRAAPGTAPSLRSPRRSRRRSSGSSWPSRTSLQAAAWSNALPRMCHHPTRRPTEAVAR